MLVVVHHGNVERTLQPLLYVEALGSLDVLQVDASEGGCYALYGLAELLGVLLVDLYVEDVDAAIYLEQQTLTLHHGLAAHGAYVAQAQHCRAVADDGHQVALVCVSVSIVGIILYLQTWKSHARRISQ